MATKIRAEISEKNKYWIDKHRHYELKHFCLQYKEWKKNYELCNESIIFTSTIDSMPSGSGIADLTSKYAIKKLLYAQRISVIEQAARDADEFLCPYILRAVTEGLSYTYLKTTLGMPCGRDMYYDRYRRFFWLLSETRN